MNLKGSKTEENLKAAFAGESQARNKYTYYACKAKKEGYNVIADVFEETARNEMAHAKTYFKLLQDGMPDTLENLKDAAGGENYEHTDMYKKFAKDAKEEGFDKIAFIFEQVGKIEADHEERFNKLHKELEEKTLFKKSKNTAWRCQFCGYIYEGDEAPSQCPVCEKPQGYFEIVCEEY
ncbi:MAG: rubrerythrin [Sarcina sp.]